MIIIAVLFFLFLVYVLIENLCLLTVRSEKLSDGEVKIVHLSDLHKKRFGKGNKRLTSAVANLKPDIIIFSGDLISRDCTDFNDAEQLISSLSEVAPIYFSLGNHELDLPTEQYQTLIDILEKYGVKFSGNENINIKGKNFFITSAPLKRTIYKKNGRYKNLDGYTCAELIESVGESSASSINLLIAHNPLLAEVYAEWGADYTFSGHIHGGAAAIPFSNIGVLSPERSFFPKFCKGVYSVGNMKLCVSGGLGKLRLFNPSELVVYTV